MAVLTPDPRPEPRSPTASAVDSVQAQSHRARVLLVDGDVDFRAYLRNHLTPHYDVVEADRADVGLLMARAGMLDVVVAGIVTCGGIDGYGLCRALKSDPDTRFIPVILLTSAPGAASRIEGLADGADDCLAQSCHPTELLLRIRNRLSAKGALERHRV